MIARFNRWWLVRILAWAMCKMPPDELRPAFDRCFRHRGKTWRDDLFSAARERVASRLTCA